MSVSKYINAHIQNCNIIEVSSSSFGHLQNYNFTYTCEIPYTKYSSVFS